ncbi:hypothetical protein D3C80_131940 [compost metagenome]
MNKTFIALMVASIVLTGCGKSDEEIRQEQLAQQAQLELIAQQNAKAQQEADDLELAGIITELKKGDPLVKDAYYGYNEKGERTLHVVRENPPQPVQQPQYQQGANGQPVIINNTQPAASSGVSESVWPLLAGAGAGMMLANAINSGGGYNNYQQSHRPYSNSYYNDDSSYRRERTKVVNNYHTTVVQKTRQTVRANPTAYQNRLGSTQQFQSAPKPAVKPNTGAGFGQVQPRAVQAPAVKPASSGWGSPSKPATAPAVKPSSGGGWGLASKPVVKSNNTGWGGSGGSGYSRPSATPSRSSYSPSRSSGRR